MKIDKPISLDERHDLVYSPNDNGWYIQEFGKLGTGDSRTSKIYKTSRDAWTAYRDNTVRYGKWE
jgi:hypothetical protein